MIQWKATGLPNKSSKWCLARQGPSSTIQTGDSWKALYSQAWPVLSAHKSHTHTHTHTEAADYCSQITHTHTHTQKLRITTLNFPPRLPCRLVEGPHPGVNGTEPACLCRDWNQSKASWKQLLREDFQICMEGRLSWDWQKLSPFLTIEKVSDALWKMRQLGECPLGDWQWMLEHSCQGLAWMSALGGESWGGVGEATS